MKKFLTLVLSLLMAGNLLLTACGEKTQNGDAGNSASTATGETETAAETTIYDTLPTADYEGYTFRVMTTFSNFAITNIDTAETTGEIMNDTIFNRNRLVEQKLNIQMYEEIGLGYHDPQDRLTQMVTAGDDQFDIMFSESSISAPSAADGYFLNLYDIRNINWDNPWWEEDVRNHFEIGGNLYFTYTPMHLHYYESLITVLFNKTIADTLQLPNLYDTVAEGKWTLDTMTELGLSAVSDVNGDGKMAATDDRYALTASTGLIQYHLIGAGGRFTDINEDGNVQWLGATEQLVAIGEKLANLYSDKTICLNDNDRSASKFPLGYIDAFISGHALFLYDVLGEVKDLRDMDADFGILPLPKFDEAQEDYISTSYCGASIMIVPVTNKKAADIGPILEHLSAYSYRDLLPAYYEINIQGKSMRDEDSIVILENMLSNIAVDMCLIFNWGDAPTEYRKAVQKGEGFVSAFEKLNKSAEKAVADFMEDFAN